MEIIKDIPSVEDVPAFIEALQVSRGDMVGVCGEGLS
jgi:hypothetical protein